MVVWRCVSRSRSPLPPRFDANASSSEESKNESMSDEHDSDDEGEVPVIRPLQSACVAFLPGRPTLHSVIWQV